MATKYDVRIAAKHDIARNWEAVEDVFVPMNGEIIVYHEADSIFDENGNISTDAKTIKLKIGDGVSRLQDLDFLYCGLEAAVLRHVTNQELHLTVAQKMKIDQSVVAYTILNSDVTSSTDRSTWTAVYSTDLKPET